MSEQLVDDEWIVVFYGQTGALRLHPSVDAARQHSVATKNLYKSPKDFQIRHDHFTLEAFWRKAYEFASWRFSCRTKPTDYPLTEADATPPDCDTERFSRELWAFMQKIGDRVTRLSVNQTRSKDHYQIDLKKLRSLIADEAAFKAAYPKQCRIIMERLAKYDSPYQLESELNRMMINLVATAQLRTKQDPWLIFQYYRVQLIKDGFIQRGNEAEDDE